MLTCSVFSPPELDVAGTSLRERFLKMTAGLRTCTLCRFAKVFLGLRRKMLATLPIPRRATRPVESPVASSVNPVTLWSSMTWLAEPEAMVATAYSGLLSKRTEMDARVPWRSAAMLRSRSASASSAERKGRLRRSAHVEGGLGGLFLVDVEASSSSSSSWASAAKRVLLP